jgi:hypothetical protein
MGIGIGWVMCIVYVEYKSVFYVALLAILEDCKGLVVSYPYFEGPSVLVHLELIPLSLLPPTPRSVFNLQVTTLATLLTHAAVAY